MLLVAQRKTIFHTSQVVLNGSQCTERTQIDMSKNKTHTVVYIWKVIASNYDCRLNINVTYISYFT